MNDRLLNTRDVTQRTEFSIVPDKSNCAALAEDLGILGVRKLRFEGHVEPDGANDLRLAAKLGATVVQPCVVTLEPVTTRIDQTVSRSYLAELPDVPEGDEVEMPEDDTAEPLPREIDLNAVMTEALSLALPDWPRADGAEPVELTVTEPGKVPMDAEAAKPFAALGDLRKKLDGNGEEND